ncbi:ParB/RepB/Spo0J family partition protein [Thermosulfurimonas sp. F29]|uniref:ParB/RepB/Spo0J family partition protein n=1 Tax=Thermosulfurimonas sp. F29 TaxID=2867247 RepID=UPI001C830415|nr:ParB/RepB/Spo0J family partition protein [Thermosulfurimonas sp. F29]MBX6422237.1 ParB/RepB/Spo0J family partition protein [Thermosulfurimonas sp. F29]
MRELARFEDPVKRQPLRLAVFEIDEVKVPPFQRDISEGLKKHLELAIEKLGFITPIIVCPHEGAYYVVDGQHRLEALRDLGAREVVAVVAPEELYLSILEFNTEKPPNVKEKSRQAYRLFQEFLRENPETIEADLFTYFKEPQFLTFGFVLEEMENRFPASFYESLLAKIDRFLEEPLSEAAEERRRRAQALVDLNQEVNAKYAELGWTNALLKGEIVRKAVQRAYGVRVRTIEDEYYDALSRVKEAVRELGPTDFGGME